MTNESQNNKRIAKNTLILYARMLLTVGISFYSTRLILANLGVSNYGIYNVIGGFVGMFHMVSSTLTQAVGRFMTVELGRGDERKLQQTFSTSVNILLLLSVVVLLLGETVGLWFVNAKLNIDPDRMVAANWIYQFSLFSFLVEMVSTPYGGAVIAHERMGTFAFVTVAKVLLTFCIALSLAVSPIDTLVFYGILVFSVSASVQLMYWAYCRRHFAECRYSVHIEKGIFREMFGFAGWNFLTTSAAMLSSSGLSILLNMHFGTTINAARGVASQINGISTAFARNFMTALNPQITKSYAAGNTDYTRKLMCNGAKFSYFLFLLVALPCLMETDFIMSVWLKEVPPYAGIFVRLALLNTMVEILLNTSETVNAASGKIRNYQILVGSTQLLILVGSIGVVRLTANPVYTMAVTNVLYLLIFVPRVLANKPFIRISWAYYARSVLKDVVLATSVALLGCLAWLTLMQPGWARLVCVGTTSTALVVGYVYGFVLGRAEKEKIHSLIRNRLGWRSC